MMPRSQADNALVEAPSNGWRAEAFRRLLNERVDFFSQVTNYCLLGATEEQLGTFFGYDRETWLYWMKHSAQLREAVEAGGAFADAEVASAMKKRAMGYEYVRQKLLVGKNGEGQVFDLTEHVPPDTSAGKFWLVNRSKNWSDKQEHSHTGQVEVDKNITIEFVGAKSSQVIDITPASPGMSPANEQA